jgi:hypothetical protein
MEHPTYEEEDKHHITRQREGNKTKKRKISHSMTSRKTGRTSEEHQDVLEWVVFQVSSLGALGKPSTQFIFQAINP